LKLRDRVNIECDMIGKYVARAILFVEADLQVGLYGDKK
jgi:riboflavin synthase alpha subunit